MKESVDTILTDEAIRVIDELSPDFVLLYMVDTDEKGGHDSGWMTEEYLKRVSIAIDNAKRIIDRYSGEYSVIITSDHGGHDRSHGTEMPEDMIIPMFFIGERFEGGRVLSDVSLLDIAPTVADIMGMEPDPDWEGHSVI